MLHRVAFLTLCLVGITFGLSGSAFAAESDDLLRWIPASSNSIAIVRVQKLLQSPHGRMQKWAQMHREMYTSGLISTPPGVEEIVRATEIRTAGAESAATFSLYRTTQEMAVRQIAERDGVPVDMIGELVAVRSLRGPYFVQLAPKLMGGVQPADRQVLSRWIRSAGKGPPAPGDNFLHLALTTDEHEQVVIAVDMSDMLDPASVASWIGSLPRSNGQVNVDELAVLFASIKGFRFSLDVTDKITSRLQLTFGRPVGPNGPGVEKCVLAWLDESGGRIEQLDAPVTTVKGNKVTMQTQIDEEGFRRVVSLIQAPHAEVGADLHVNLGEKGANGIATRNYFQAVNQLVDNLTKQNRKANDYNKTALWHDNFARKIEGLPVSGVDPDVVAWGNGVVDHLRALANSLRGVPVEVDKLDRKVRVHVQVRGYRYASTPYADLYRPGSYYADSNLPEVRAQQAEAVANMSDQRDEIWNMIYADRNAVAKTMEDKYKLPFVKP